MIPNDYETDYIKIYVPYHRKLNNDNTNTRQATISYHNSRFPYRIALDEPHILESPTQKIMIRGYAGFRPNKKNIVGIPLIPNERVQRSSIIEEDRVDDGTTTYITTDNDMNDDNQKVIDRNNKSTTTNYHQQKEMDIIERYNRSVQSLLSLRGQTQEKLLKIVQSKLSESDLTSAQLLIR